ncbi:zinc-ribbon domain-containing protein [Candidatus Thorarchaeota archaeon]|nr:MAG: zinc-ribbon domain-containing protein [Candidatus Thorarchaeota archaeon]
MHQLRNIQEPELFVIHGQEFDEVDPNAKMNNLDLKIESQLALTISQNFQEVLAGARQRLATMEQLQKITKERLTDQLKVMENVISSEMTRWDKRLKTQEESSALRIEKLQIRMSDKSYRLKEKHQKDRRALLAQFARDTVELERFFIRILDDIKTSREGLIDIELEDAIQKYQSLADVLTDTVPTYVEVVDSINELAKAATLSAGDLDAKLARDIREEEESINAQIREIQQQLEEMREERDVKEREFKTIKSKVQTAVESMDGMVEKRVEGLTYELQRVQRLTLENESIKGLAPLTLIHFKTWVATYTTGNPVIFAPVLVPEDRIALPYNHQPMDQKLEKFLKRLVSDQLKDSASFKTSFKDACDTGNVLKNPESVKIFKRGIDDLWTRQLLKEGVREKLEPLYTALAGRCPECKAEISENSKFCPECGKSLK